MSLASGIPKSKKSLPCTVWNETLNFLGQRRGMQTLLSAGTKAIDWVKFSSSNANTPVLDNARQMLYDTKSVISLTNVPERALSFGESLSYAGKRPSSASVSDAVLSGLALSSFLLSLGAKLLQRTEVLQFSWHTFKNLKLFSSVISLASSGKASFNKISHIFTRVRDLNAVSFVQSAPVKKHLLFNESLNLYISGSKLGLSMLSIANLIGMRIAPVVFLTVSTSSLAASVLCHYHYQIAVKPDEKVEPIPIISFSRFSDS